MALGAIRAVRRAGLRVPEDVSVIGYDDSALMNCTEPPLTTVRQPIEAMGRMVIELLMRQMSSEAPIGDEVFFAPEPVVRSSTAPAPADAATEARAVRDAAPPRADAPRSRRRVSAPWRALASTDDGEPRAILRQMQKSANRSRKFTK